jgi:hypothetical protein
MEIYPDDYDDPEERENQWVLPSLPDPALVPDNTKSCWIFYAWRGEPRQGQWPVTVAVTREITAPWRRGLGIMLRRKDRASAVGVWMRGKPPRILSDAPAEQDWHDVVTRANDLERGLEHN